MDRHDGLHRDGRIPLILRRMSPERRHLAGRLVGRVVEVPGGVWWELVDAAAAGQSPPAGVARLHHEPGSWVTVSAIGVPQVDSALGYETLLLALVADLRAQAVDLVSVRSVDRDVVRALATVGFGLMPGAGDRYQLAL